MIRVFLSVEVCGTNRLFHAGASLNYCNRYRNQMKIKSGFALEDKSDDIVDIFGTTSINRACARRFRKCLGLLC